MLHKVTHKGFLILSNEPLICTDEIILVHLALNDLSLQIIGPSQFLHVPEEMPKSVDLNDHIVQVLPLRNHNITNHVVQIELRNAGHSHLQKSAMHLHLNIRRPRLQLVSFQHLVYLLLLVTNSREKCSQVQVTIVKVHPLVNGNLFSTDYVRFDQRVQLRDLRSFKEHTDRPQQFRKYERSYH
jgi:hypothetical protein